MDGEGQERLAAEQRARVLIDRQLADAGWAVQDRKTFDFVNHQGVALREAVMKPGHGRADYLLYVDQRVVGVIEAKPEGATLSGVEWQSAMYAAGLPDAARKRAVVVDDRLPFVFEASGAETQFTNGYDPNARARRVFAFPKPSTLAKVLRDAEGQAADEFPCLEQRVPSHVVSRAGLAETPEASDGHSSDSHWGGGSSTSGSAAPAGRSATRRRRDA